MPITIITGAGDRPKMSASAGPRHAEAPAVEVVEAEADQDDGCRGQHHAHDVDPHVRPAFVRLQPKLRKNTIAETTIRSPNTGRQPMKVPSSPPIRNAATPAAARADPVAPTAVACCWPW